MYYMCITHFFSLCIFPFHRVSPWGAHAIGAFLPDLVVYQVPTSTTIYYMANSFN